MKKPVKKKQSGGGLPSREDVLAFIGTHKGKAGVREIARAFGLKNADRAALRQMVRGLTDEGALEGRRFGADPGRSLGDHPQRGGAILVKKGRYGPYVTNNGINATIPDDKNPEEITLDEAVALIEARADKTGAKPAPRRKEPRKAASARVAKPVADGEKKPKTAAKGAAKKKTAAKRAPKKTVTAAE